MTDSIEGRREEGVSCVVSMIMNRLGPRPLELKSFGKELLQSFLGKEGFPTPCLFPLSPFRKSLVPTTLVKSPWYRPSSSRSGRSDVQEEFRGGMELRVFVEHR